MSEPKMPPPEKNRKNRSFGSFLLFLLVLVTVLFTFRGDHFGRKKLSQDQFWWSFYRGEVAEVNIGEKSVSGRLKNDTFYEVPFRDMEGKEEILHANNGIRNRKKISEAGLRRGIEAGDYRPTYLVQLIATEAKKSQATQEGGAPAGPSESLENSTATLVLVDANALGSRQTAALGYPLEKEPGSYWLQLDEVKDYTGLTAMVAASGAEVERRHLSLGEGTNAQFESGLLSSMLLIWAPWVLILVFFFIFMRQMRSQGGAGGVMSFGRSRAQLYTKENHTNVTFEDVAGNVEAKSEVREVVEFLKNPGRFTRIGGRIPRGILLVGSPGCGKTLLAKAIAGEAEVPFYSISGSDFVEMFVGVGASRVRDLFKQARDNSPCIIFLDEIDAVGRRRGSGMGGGHDEREQTLNAILVEMDGFGTDEGIIVIAATNRPDVLDPALLRPGRFDREVTIDLPDAEAREQILAVHIKKVKASSDINLSVLARSTPGYSGADLAATVNEAAIMAVLDKQDEVKMEHLEEARDKVRYGRKKLSAKLQEDDRRITAYHESGHAVVALELEDTDDPHKVTIVPRGRALGATMMVPEKESYHMQKRRLLAQLAVLFGGRAAEEVFCGDISAGASDDIRRATELARTMITELGMSDKIGPINYAERQGSDFLGTELLSGKWHSEETAREIDAEVKTYLSKAYERAISIVREQSEVVLRMADALMRYETLDAAEMKALLAGAEVDSLRPGQKEEESTPPAAPAPAKPEPKKGGDELAGGLPGEAGFSPA
ncbi:MAG: ATP-dependent zinc metalloprotease FtsH [Planctomycetes bacterium]|nr:ATP-dependent zinc metalloprotease FtsH [Planctomycetota bacterium]MCB9903471.1 ATP-dependent zinc metalloprotease FtsH [Planctomycetota bacterium]